MKLTIVTDEKPFPAIHGGRVDVWRRLQAFAAEGVKIQLVYWYATDDVPDDATSETLNSLCESVLAFPISRAWTSRFKALAKLVRQSLYISTRDLDGAGKKKLAEEFQRFSPDAIWLDGLFGGKVSMELADRFDKPLFNRSRNIEFAYRQKQFERALGFRDKLAAWMAKSHLESFELSVLKKAKTTWDISLDDLRYWKDRGIENIEWLPPFADQNLIEQLQTVQSEPEYDLVYLGNLYTPNNIEGVSWFLQKVLPIISEKRKANLLLAGAKPHLKIRRLSEAEGTTLLANAPGVAETYARGRVLINPILAGSGVNVKSVEMLFSGKTVVTCPQGAAGLPADTRAYFQVAKTPEEFAAACLEALENPARESPKRELSAYTFQAIKPVIERMQALINA